MKIQNIPRTQIVLEALFWASFRGCGYRKALALQASDLIYRRPTVLLDPEDELWLRDYLPSLEEARALWDDELEFIQRLEQTGTTRRHLNAEREYFFQENSL